MPKPSLYDTGVLRSIYGSVLIKTRLPSKPDPIWAIAKTGEEISNACAQKLIRNKWVVPNRDGLSMFDESQTYFVPKVIDRVK